MAEACHVCLDRGVVEVSEVCRDEVSGVMTEVSEVGCDRGVSRVSEVCRDKVVRGVS